MIRRYAPHREAGSGCIFVPLINLKVSKKTTSNVIPYFLPLDGRDKRDNNETTEILLVRLVLLRPNHTPFQFEGLPLFTFKLRSGSDHI